MPMVSEKPEKDLAVEPKLFWELCGCDKTRDEPSQVTDRGHGEWS